MDMWGMGCIVLEMLLGVPPALLPLELMARGRDPLFKAATTRDAHAPSLVTGTSTAIRCRCDADDVNLM